MPVKSLFAFEQAPVTEPLETAVTSFNSTTNIITTSAAAAPVAGTALKFTNSGGALPSGLSTDTIYYVLTPSTNTFSVATTVGGTAVSLGSAGTGTSSYWTYAVMSSDSFWVPHESLKILENVTIEDRDQECDGTVDSRSGIPIEYNPEWEMKVKDYPNLVGIGLLLALGNVTSTPGDGIITDPDGNTIPVGAYKHVFAYKTGIDVRTMSYWGQDQDANNWHATGMGLETLKISGTKGSLDIDLKGKALYVEEFGDPGATAFPADTLVPWAFGQLGLTWVSGGAIVEEFNFEFAQSCKTEHAPIQAGCMWPTIYELDKGVARKLTGNCNKRQLSITDWNALVGGTTFSATAKYQTRQLIGTTTYPFSMWINMPECQYQKGTPDDIKKEPRRANKLTWKANYDTAGAEPAFTITLVNSVAGYMTGIS